MNLKIIVLLYSSKPSDMDKVINVFLFSFQGVKEKTVAVHTVLNALIKTLVAIHADVPWVNIKTNPYLHLNVFLRSWCIVSLDS